MATSVTCYTDRVITRFLQTKNAKPKPVKGAPGENRALAAPGRRTLVRCLLMLVCCPCCPLTIEIEVAVFECCLQNERTSQTFARLGIKLCLSEGGTLNVVS